MIRYEWAIETFDEYGDVTEVDHHDKFPGLPPAGQDVVLVRDRIADDENLEERTWAYIENGKLPERFDNGRTKVPKRFHAEVAAGVKL